MPHVKTRLGIRAMTIAKFGQSMPRVEDRVLLTGRGRYVDDMSLPGQAHGVLVYSSHAHARIGPTAHPPDAPLTLISDLKCFHSAA